MPSSLTSEELGTTGNVFEDTDFLFSKGHREKQQKKRSKSNNKTEKDSSTEQKQSKTHSIEYSKKHTALTWSKELTNGFEYDVVTHMGASQVMKKAGSILKNCYTDDLNDYLEHIASWKNVDREERMNISFVDFQ